MTPEYHSATTLNRIRAAQPCREGWMKLLARLGKTAADDEPLPLLTILESNGLRDALWCLDADPALDRLKRHFQAWCAEQVLPLFEAERHDDARVRDQIAMLRRDNASDAELAAARTAARDAELAAASDAASAAAWAAASGAAWAAASDAAWAVAKAASAAVRAAQEKQLRAMMEEQQ